MRKQIYRTIYRYEGRYTIGRMCAFFRMGYSGYYKWRLHRTKPDKDEMLMELIRCRYEASKHSAGYREITLQLRKHYGLIVNHKAVYRIMMKLGIQSVARRRRAYTWFSDVVHRYDNILNRHFDSTEPNRKWVTDVTYIQTKEGVLYLSAIKDLHDGFIVSYRTGTDQSVHLVNMTIRDAFENEKKKVADGLLLHSDQGFQYTSDAYFSLMQQYAITPSMSRRGNCLDNACMENFFGMLKTEWIQRRKFSTLQEARETVDQYIHYYNYERCCLKTRLTPFEKRCQSA